MRDNEDKRGESLSTDQPSADPVLQNDPHISDAPAAAPDHEKVLPTHPTNRHANRVRDGVSGLCS